MNLSDEDIDEIVEGLRSDLKAKQVAIRQIEDLEQRGLLPKVLNKKDKNDPGIIARRDLWDEWSSAQGQPSFWEFIKTRSS